MRRANRARLGYASLVLTVIQNKINARLETLGGATGGWFYASIRSLRDRPMQLEQVAEYFELHAWLAWRDSTPRRTLHDVPLPWARESTARG